MTTNQTRQHQMLQRVSEFGSRHRDLFPEGSLGAEAFAAVAAAAHTIAQQAMEEVPLTRRGSHEKAAARTALERALAEVARNARVLDGATPGFSDTFRLPRPRSDVKLLMTGRLAVREATDARSRFMALGLPSTFVDSLAARVDDFERASQLRHESRGHSVAVRTRINVARLAGLDAVRRLDVVVLNVLRNEPALLAVWKRDRRVEYLRRSRRVSGPRRLP